MITKNEITKLDLSPVKKDFYQIWSELLDAAKKISERWDPTSTNESDPGIVLLKVATALSDKLFYNIDKNTLESYMPTAAQMESMRKLCEMMGYNMKYYRSAETAITLTYTSSDSFSEKLTSSYTGLSVPIFTVFNDTDKEITYVSTEDKILAADNTEISINCIEGQAVQCETSTDNLIGLSHLDDNYRYYLPEVVVAENGIFVYQIKNGNRSERWEKVDNLNTQSSGKLCYKFGYDSQKATPYIQFPEDIGQLIEDGLEIFYIRTSGINGNITAKTISTFEKPDSDEWEGFSVDDFKAYNASAATNGADVETINKAYNNYKKTIGTFDTLVTCRDYMNKIYQLLDDTDMPLVSNIIVSDIRDDINRAITLCSFNDYGICYKDQAVYETTTETAEKADGTGTVEIRKSTPLITNFDIVLYPFRTYKLDTQSDYTRSFKYYPANNNEIKQELEEYKTIAHNYIEPDVSGTDIVCIKNYLKLNARITTTAKVNKSEQSIILNNVYNHIYETFNARQLDFGEEIDESLIQECIEEADTRIKNVSITDIGLYTMFALADGNEYGIDTTATEANKCTGNGIYNKLTLRNIIAGRLALFNYDNNFKYELDEKKYTAKSYDSQYPNVKDYQLLDMTSECPIKTADLTKAVEGRPTESTRVYGDLMQNEVIQFRAINFKSLKTYSAYVNYYLCLNNKEAVYAIPMTVMTVRQYMTNNSLWTGFATRYASLLIDKTVTAILTAETLRENYGVIFKDSTGTEIETAAEVAEGTTVYIMPFTEATFPYWNSYIASTVTDQTMTTFGIYRNLGYSSERVVGKYVDQYQNKYQLCTQWRAVTTPLDNLYVPILHANDEPTKYTAAKGYDWGWTKDGLGRDAKNAILAADTEHLLQPGEYLYMYYTESGTDDNGETTKTARYIYWGPGRIIKANFDLEDSSTRNRNKAWECKQEKYSNENFGEADDNGKAVSAADATEKPGSEIPGMYTTGTDEQIEIRTPVCVDFANGLNSGDEEVINLYWDIADIETYGDLQERLDANNHRYTLKDGEYLYYTDEHKLSFVYYGSGTEIVVTGSKWNLTKADTDDDADSDDLIEQGLNAIPWQTFTVSKSNDLYIYEYQYINLVEGNTLTQCALKAGSDPSVDTTVIDNDFKAIDTNTEVKYEIDGVETKLPLIDVIDDDSKENYGWHVRSLLQFNMGPTTTQTLYNTRDKITANYYKTTYDPYTGDETIIKPGLSVELSPGIEDSLIVPLAIKSNITLQKAQDAVDTHVTKTSTEDDTIEYINNFKIRLFDQEDVIASYTDSPDSAVTIHNFGTNWTKLPTLNGSSKLCTGTKINVTIPTAITGSGLNYYGLLLIYASSDTTNPCKMTCTDCTPVIFNNYASDSATDETWWTDDGYVAGNVYTLKPGVNVVKFTTSGTITLSPENEANMLIISDLDVIEVNGADKGDYGLDLDTICYMPIGNGNTTQILAKQLLNDLRELDPEHKFYYNCPMDNSLMIALNDNTTDDDKETMTMPKVWYDHNNINNKFVISEIDAKYMKSGIIIAPSSKLQ